MSSKVHERTFHKVGVFGLAMHVFFVVCLVLFGGCGRTNEEAGGPKIAGIVFQEDQFFRLIQYGMKAAAEKYDVDLRLANSSNSLEREISLIDTYIVSKVDAIVISPLSTKGSITGLRRAHDNGIKVITCGFILDDFPEYVIESNDTQLGTSAARATRKYIEEKLNGTAKIAMVEYVSQMLEVGHMRPDGFRSVISEIPGVEIVAEQDAWLASQAADVVDNILTAHPDLDIIWAANEGGTVGAVTAVRDSGKAGQVVVFGTDMSEQIADFLLADENILQAVTGQKPFEMGFKALEAAVRVLNGEPVEKRVRLPGVLFTRERPDEIKQYKERLQELTK